MFPTTPPQNINQIRLGPDLQRHFPHAQGLPLGRVFGRTAPELGPLRLGLAHLFDARQGITDGGGNQLADETQPESLRSSETHLIRISRCLGVGSGGAQGCKKQTGLI